MAKAEYTVRQPLFRSNVYDAADREVRFADDGETLPSPEVERLEQVIREALRARLFSRSDSAALKRVRRYVADLDLPLHRLARLYHLIGSEVWMNGDPKKGTEDGPKPGYGCTRRQWRDAAFLAHRAALSILVAVRPQSYSDVNDQLQMLFYASNVSLEQKARKVLQKRLPVCVARLAAGLPFALEGR